MFLYSSLSPLHRAENLWKKLFIQSLILASDNSCALFNARIGGLYDLVSYLCMDDDYAKRQDKMQKRAESVGLGGANKVANLAIDAGGTSKLLKKLGLKYIK